jgi:hypothetical protein
MLTPNQKIPAAIKITEAPRDAMQGIKRFIPTRQKAQLIKIGRAHV